ncbi:MAG: NAD(P)-dependent oxidoreductase [Thermoanaerobaculia bacterium]
MKRVLIAADLDPVLLQLLRDDPRFETVHRPTHSEQELAGTISGFHVLVTRYHNRVTRAVLERADGLDVIIQGTSGLDNIDHPAAAERGIAIIGIPGENANAVAELVLGHMISLTRTVPFYDRSMRKGAWIRDDCATRRELRSFQLGIVGIGRVGSRVAAIAGNLGMKPLSFDPYLSRDEIARRGAKKVETLDELLAKSEILTFHVPLTEETDGMLGAGEIERLPVGAAVINSSRGEVVDLAALLDALERGHLGGAALDVFDPEPPSRSWPDDPRLILTPHIAGCTREAKLAIGKMVYRRLCEYYALAPAGDADSAG